MTAIYAVLHLFVDGMCALIMFGKFLDQGNGSLFILLYNFSAFALQMPLGLAIDMLCRKRENGLQTDFPLLFAVAGVLCTIVGAFTHPMVLGLGNALFHVGGGVGTIQEDDLRHWCGRGLGVFVAPGALGLYLGTLAGKNDSWQMCALGAGVVMVLLCIRAALQSKDSGRGKQSAGEGQKNWERQEKQERQRKREKATMALTCQFRKGTWVVVVSCVLVVILRSYVGLAVDFPWKSGTLASAMAVLTVVGGKIAGGFAAARYGFLRATFVSLGLSACCFLISGHMPAGLGALFFFNMTMPITLYWMACRMPGMPGFAFGLLTFALFLGFLPVYFGWMPKAGGNILGTVGSITSLLLTAGYRWAEERTKDQIEKGNFQIGL